jgi:hypothetical protein
MDPIADAHGNGHYRGHEFGKCGAIELQIVNVREELPAFHRQLGYVETGIAPFPSAVSTKMECHFVTMAKAL